MDSNSSQEIINVRLFFFLNIFRCFYLIFRNLWMTCWKKPRLCELLNQPWNETKECFHWEEIYTFQYKGCELWEKERGDKNISTFLYFTQIISIVWNFLWKWRAMRTVDMKGKFWTYFATFAVNCVFCDSATLVVAGPGLTVMIKLRMTIRNKSNLGNISCPEVIINKL